jgi:hypothetical protein
MVVLVCMAFLLVSCGGDSGSIVKSKVPPAIGTGTGDSGGAGELVNGMQIWSFNLLTSDEVKIDAHAFEDINSSAAIADDGTIYVGSKSRYLYALSPGGAVKWGYETRIHHQTKPCRQIEDFMMIRASISARRP